MDPNPKTEEDALVWAFHYVGRLAAKERPYTSADAEKESHMGCGGPKEPGYGITHGKLTIPYYSKPQWTFKYADIESRIKSGSTLTQASLF